MKKILITGGTGFIGRELALGLSSMDYDVTVVSTLSNPDNEKVREARSAGIEMIKCDIFSEEFGSVVSKSGPDALIHAAGIAGLTTATGQTASPLDYSRMNVESTVRALNASRDAGAEQFVYLGSAAVYGKSVYLPIDERHPTNPISQYGISKLEGEKRANEFRSENMRVFIPRIFNVYGKSPTRPDVVSQIIKSVERNQQPVLNGEGKPTRDFIYVKDVVDAVEIGVRRKLDTTLNVGTGRETSLLELVGIIIKEMDSNLKPKLLPGRPGDIDRSVADVSDAKKAGIEAKVSLEEGIGILTEH